MPLVDGQERLGAGVDLLVSVQDMACQGEVPLSRIDLDARRGLSAAWDLLVGFQDDLHAGAGGGDLAVGVELAHER